LDLARTAADARRAARERDDRDIMLDVEARLLAALGDYGQGSTERGAAELVKALRDGLAGAVLTEDMINDVGYYCLENGFSEAAVVAFRFNAEQFPDSANAHDSLGEALVAVGRPAEAADSYRRALQLDPRLSSSRAALDRLDAEQ
jgi:tetratricopeptide (TPR) repeat protein